MICPFNYLVQLGQYIWTQQSCCMMAGLQHATLKDKRLRSVQFSLWLADEEVIRLIVLFILQCDPVISLTVDVSSAPISDGFFYYLTFHFH